MEHNQQQHLLVATFPFQGHINPALHLAKHLARTTSFSITFSTSHYAHRRMFPSSSTTNLEEFNDGLLSYIPYSDSLDDTSSLTDVPKFHLFMDQFSLAGSRSLSALLTNLADLRRPVTCIIYTMLLPWAADVAREHNIPSVHYWIQPAAVFAMYYHFFHDYHKIITDHIQEPSFSLSMRGLPTMTIGDLPSFLLNSPDDPFYSIYLTLRDSILVLDREKEVLQGRRKPMVLVNTFEALESEALSAVSDIDVLPIGPLMPVVNNASSDGDACNIFKSTEERLYMEWLDLKPKHSVVYVSFGSLHRFKRQQLKELLAGLEDSKRPYVWVVRKGNLEQEGFHNLESEAKNGMIVEWCSQVKVLCHPSVGCFVTHCGWNSILESLACGVPTVGAPQLSDQKSNARLVEETWGTGMKAKVNEEGVLEGCELVRCLNSVMGNEGIRRKVRIWRERAREAVDEGGPSDRNLKVFLEDVGKGWCES